MSNEKKTLDYKSAVSILRGRLIRAVFRISEQTHTGTRSVLDGFGRHITPAMADNGDTMFTFNPRRHLRTPDRTMNFSKTAVLLSLVGIAVLDYYAAVKKPNEDTVDILTDRVKRLEEIAELGPSQFRATGNEAIGYTLERLPEAEIKNGAKPEYE
jgi:hypothetical protein